MKMFRAIRNFDGSDSEKCISLATGDWLSSVYSIDSDWYIGHNERSGETGAFPSSCVTKGSVEKTTIADRNADKTPGVFTLSQNSAETSLSYHPDMHRAISNPGSVVSGQESIFDSSFEKSGTQDSGANKSMSDKGVLSSEGDAKGSFQRRKKDKLGALMASTDMLFNSGREENKRMKAGFGAVAGLVIGGLLFVLLVYSFGYRILVAGICALVCTVFICIGLAFFPACRCVMALVFPNFLTGKGRAILLSVIFAVMLTGPILNITDNAKETGNSMACVIDLIANQTRSLQNQLTVPVKDIVKYIVQQREAIQKIKNNLVVDLDRILKTLGTLVNQFDTLNTNLNTVYQKCVQPIIDASNGCTKTCNGMIFGIRDVCLTQCSKINSMAGICSQLKFGNSFADFTNQLKSTLDKAESFFKIDVVVEENFDASTNSSKDINTIQDEINEQIGSKVVSFQFLTTVLKYVLSLSLLLMFLQAYLYFKNYMSKDGYDNVYITKEFIELDEKKEVEGEEAILPLKKTENAEYTRATSLKLNKQEFANCKVGLTQVFLHFIFCFVVIIFDYFLYYILNLIQKFGNIDINVHGAGLLKVSVNGNGNIANFYRVMFKAINFDEKFLAEIQIGRCLPKPTAPSGEHVISLILLYLLAVCFVILRGYAVRLRRKIAAYYYPEQETARIEYLHKTIRHRRIARQRFLRQEVKSTHKESVMKDKFRLSTWLLNHCPCMGKCIASRNQLECSSCEEKQGKFSSVKLTKCPGQGDGVACTAVYCEDCKVLLNGVCPLCTRDQIELRD